MEQIEENLNSAHGIMPRAVSDFANHIFFVCTALQ